MQSRYIALLPQIQAIFDQGLAPWDVVPVLNDFIIRNQISDKPIALTERAFDLISWNIACGGGWVDTSLQPGQKANKAMPNPTFNNPVDHAGRMQCVAAIVKGLKELEEMSIVFQEAPTNPNDIFYQLTGAIPAVNYKSGANVHRAALGAVEQRDNITQALEQILKNHQLSPHEYQIVIDSNNPNFNKYIVNIHFDYAPSNWKANVNESYPHQWQQNRAQALVDIMNWAATNNQQSVYIMGDSNIVQQIALQTLASNGIIFDANGADTVDVIMRAGLHSNVPMFNPTPVMNSPQIVYPPVMNVPSSPNISNPTAVVYPPKMNNPSSSVSSSSSPAPSSLSQSYGGMFQGAGKKGKEKSPLDRLAEEKAEINTIIREHSDYLNSKSSKGTDTSQYEQELAEAKSKLLLVDFKIAYLKDAKKDLIGGSKSEGMKDKIVKGELKSITEVMDYAIEHPTSRTAKILKDQEILDVSQAPKPKKK